jgi:hypothetical protein
MMCVSAESELKPNESVAFVHFCRGWMLALAISVLLLAASANAAHPQSGIPDTEFQFDIPSQPLESALEAYGTTSRLQVLYETALTSGRYSTKVNGMYTREAALRRLLSGTGLGFGYTEDRSFTLVPAPPRGTVRPRQVAEFNEFFGDVQSGIIAALCRQQETRPGTFRLAMQFSIGGSGKLENLNLLGTTGIASRDVAIAGLLTGLAFDQAPPRGIPQPITMILRGGSANADDECDGVKR